VSAFSSRRFRGWIGAALVVLTASAVSRALVLTSITIDGTLSDWSAVLADSFQLAADGPAGGLLDRDAPVGSTGRDLTGFAWTWDSTYLYFSVSRVASDSNRLRFWYYLDTNEDGKMATGEYVVGVSWFGSNRRTDVELYRYNAIAPGGDSLGDASGFADGWDMPGTVTLLSALESVFGGAANGIQMESRVPWATLGVASGTPVRFHVGSSNNTNLPSGLLDNMAGPGGLVGWTRSAGVRLDPDRTSTSISPGLAVFAHTATNLGSHADAVNLAGTSSGAFAPSSLVFRHDANADGALDAGDPLLTDSDGDGKVDTGSLAAGASTAILAVATVPSGLANGTSCTLTLTASSSKKPAATETATDALTIATPSLTLVKSADKATAPPGGVVTYTLTYTSGGTASAFGISIVDQVPANTTYVAGSAAGAVTTIAFSHDGGATYDALETAPVTHIRWQRTSPLAPGGSGTTSFKAAVR
jgi:uncharacterized repeat protein (TIGR01451 family)